MLLIRFLPKHECAVNMRKLLFKKAGSLYQKLFIFIPDSALRRSKEFSFR